MNSEEIKQIKETLKYYETTKTEPTYCEELITTGELKRIVEEIEKLENIIKEIREYVKQLIDLKEEDYLKSVSLIYIEKILEILDKEDKNGDNK